MLIPHTHKLFKIPLFFYGLLMLMLLGPGCEPPYEPSDVSQGDQAKSGEIGAACQQPTDCHRGLCLTGAPGGYCSLVCDGSHVGMNECPAGSMCVSLNSGGTLCLDLCTKNNDCRNGYWCSMLNQSLGVCFPKCRNDSDCAPGYTCNQIVGGCVQGSSTAGVLGRIGGPCQSDRDCQGSLCATSLPNGYCTAKCDQYNPCATGGVCIQLSQELAACLGSCTGHHECRAEYFCAALDNGGGVCIPRCNVDNDCNAGFICDRLSGQCTQGNTAQPVNMKVETRPIGTIDVTTNGSQVFSVTVPQGAISLTLVASSPGGPMMAFAKIADPQNNMILDILDPQSPIRALPNTGFASVQIPNSPQISLMSGTYQFMLVSQTNTQAQVTALIKFADTSPTRGTLNINFHFVGLPDVSAATAPNDPDFQQVVSGIRNYYAPAGISLGQINYFDITGPQADEFTVIDTIEGQSNELVRLFMLSRDRNNNALNFFFVREIRGGGAGFTILGMAGGIPGPSSLHGTQGSGVVVMYGQTPVSVIAHTAAHEAGHYLGLYHLSERTGTAHDPLPDTPMCTLQHDLNQDGIVSAEECQNAGGDYLMFWTPGNFPQHKISPNQIFVLLRNPLIQ